MLGAALVASLVVLPVSPAHAAAGDRNGRWAGSYSDCSSNYRIGQTSRIRAWNPYSSSYEDFGYAEWRYSGNGGCRGYQWVRLHIEKELWVVPEGPYGWLQLHEWRIDNNPNFVAQLAPDQVNVDVWGPAWGPDKGSVFRKGRVIDSGLVYSPTLLACSFPQSNVIVSNWDNRTTRPLVFASGDLCA